MVSTGFFVQAAQIHPRVIVSETPEMSFYEERQFALRSGDCLLLTTDGVTEAADGHDEESAANE